MGKGSSSIRQWAMRILCVLALAFVGFGAPPDVSEGGDLTPAKLAQYQLPDGSFPILCITYRDGDGKLRGKVHVPCCDTSHTAAPLLVPEPPVSYSVFRPGLFVLAVRPKVEAFHRQLYPPNSGPRAPPLLAISA